MRFFLTKDFKKFLLEQPKDTVFHFHSVFIPWFLPAVKLLKQHGFNRVVLTPHGQYIDEAMSISLKKRIFFHFFDRNILRTVDAVQLIGATEQNSYVTANAKEYHLIPNGCMPVETSPQPKDQLCFGYMGRLDMKQKGLDILCQAFAFYKKQGGKGYLKIAGDGSDKIALEEMCQNIGMSDSVSFVGKIFGKDKEDFLDSCAYFVHSSRWDVLPTGCLEAATRGIPLIVSEETNLGMYLNKFDDGFVYSSDGRPIQALADVLSKAERLFEQKNLYKEHCNHAKVMISEELNWDCIAKTDIKKLYTNTLQSKEVHL